MHTKMKNDVDPAIQSMGPGFIELIRHKLGIVMHAHQNYELFRTIQSGCERFNLTPFEYLNALSHCPDQSPLLDHLVSGITVGETYFFRDKQQMAYLQHQLLPELIREKREKNSLSIRIWSAGCSTGEEMYSIVMMLYEILPDIDQWTIKLLATDINTTTLKKAIAGEYTEWSMRSIPDYFKKTWFEKGDKRYLLKKQIRDRVNFDYLNLNDDNYPSIFNGTNAQDLIMCRNVLIYIDNTSSTQVMRRINKSLVKGGYLMLGASDPVCLSETDFVFVDRKTSLLSRPREEEKIAIPVSDVTSTLPNTKKIRVTKPYPIKKIRKETKKMPTFPKKEKDLSAIASELANSGKLDEAVKVCEEGFKKDPTNKLNYFTYSLAMSELNKLNEAESALRKTLFLDNQFVAGHFQLGLLLLRKNQHAAGLKSLKNALSIAESRKSDDTVPGSPGLSYKDFADILRQEIRLYVTNGT